MPVSDEKTILPSFYVTTVKIGQFSFTRLYVNKRFYCTYIKSANSGDFYIQSPQDLDYKILSIIEFFVVKLRAVAMKSS